MKKRILSLGTSLLISSSFIAPYANDFSAKAVHVWELDEEEHTVYKDEISNENGLTYYIYSDHAVLINVDCDLSGVTIPDSVKGVPVTVIADDAFVYTETTYISIPASVVDLGDSLGDLEHSFSVDISDKNKNYVNVDDVIYTSDMTELVKFIPSNEKEEFTIPDTVKKVHSRAFSYCENLKKVNIPSSVIEIGSAAFIGCTSLESINVDEENPFFSSADGVLFNKYKDTLHQYPVGSTKKSYTIPDFVEEIGIYAFAECKALETIEIPDSVEIIDDNAFQSCPKLNNVVMPDSVCKLGAGVFENCSSLLDITFSNKLTEVGWYAVYNTPWLKAQADGIIYIGSALYSYKGNMPENTALTVKEGTLCITDDAFYGNSYKYEEQNDTIRKNLISIKLPDSLKYIKQEAFYECENLQEIQLPDNILGIEFDAFSKCTSLKKVNIPSSLDWLGIIFRSCHSLEEIEIPENITQIVEGAFEDCTSLRSITVKNPNCSIYKPFKSPFSETDEQTFKFSGTICGYENSTVQKFAKENGYDFVSIGKYEYEEPDFDNIEHDDTWEWYNRKDHAIICDYHGDVSETLELPNTLNGLPVTEAYIHDIQDSDKIKKLIIPANITYAAELLRSLDNLTDIEVDKDNKSFVLESNALFNADKTILFRCLADKVKGEFVVPDSVTSIAYNAFKNCTGLTSIKIPASVEDIADTIEGCSSLEAIKVSKSNKYYSSVNGVLFNSNRSSIYRYPQNHSCTSYELPNFVLWICSGAFKGCDKLKSVELSDNLYTISSEAFKGCDKLESIKLPQSVKEIDNEAFSSCSSLKAIEFPDDINNLGLNIAADTPWYDDQPDGPIYCGQYLYKIKDPESKLTEITIKDGTKRIADYAFCKDITIKDQFLETIPNTSLKKVVLPDSIEKIGSFIFADCTALTEVVLPKNLKISDNDTTNEVPPIGIFAGCTSLKDIILSDNATEIRGFDYTGCDSLKEVVIPERITEIGEYSFYNCASLESITIKNPDCKISDEAYTICNSITDSEEIDVMPDAVFSGTIYGYDGSTAEKYAEKYGYKFGSLGKAPNKLGDVNGDGQINAVDASCVLAYYAKVSTNKDGGLNETQMLAADVNNDEAINSIDASCILSYYAYVSTESEGIVSLSEYLKR